MSANHPDEAAIPADRAEGADRLRHFGASATPRPAYAPSYSRRVRRLRVFLPLAGLATIGIVFLWPTIRAQFNHPTLPTSEERLARMVQGRTTGTDSHGRPFTVTYDSAERPPAGGPFDLTNPLAELTLQNGHWVAVRAAHGRYDDTGNFVDLWGDVEFFHDDGYRFTTDRAHVEFAKNLVWGDRAVEGHGPKGEVVARGFRIENNGDRITFTGPVTLTLRPGVQTPGAP